MDNGPASEKPKDVLNTVKIDGVYYVNNPTEVPDHLLQEKKLIQIDSIGIGNIISYQGKNYEVKELPGEQNGNRYVLTCSGEPVFKASEKQLTTALESGKAVLAIPETKSPNTEEAPLAYHPVQAGWDPQQTIRDFFSSSATEKPVIPPATERIKTSEILDGRDARNLAESMRIFELKSGDIVYAGTDKGIDYKDHNEDRAAVYPEQNFATVVDGMGGYGAGELAAQILAEELLLAPGDINSAVDRARNRMNEEGVGKGGAVYISARLNIGPNGKSLDISQSGDAKLIIIDKEGKVVFGSKDESRVQMLVDMKVITPDEALYHPDRNEVTRAISPDRKDDPRLYPGVVVESGDLVLLYSDGISDNFTPEEIAEKVREGLAGKELFAWLSEESNKRMQNKKEIISNSARAKDGIYSDGYKSKPKTDNRSLVIMEIKNKGHQTPAPETKTTDFLKTGLFDNASGDKEWWEDGKLVYIEKLDWDRSSLGRFDANGNRIPINTPAPEPAPPEPAVKPAQETIKAPETQILPAGAIRDQIKNLLESKKAIKKIYSLDVRGEGNKIILSLKVKAHKPMVPFTNTDVDVKATFESREGVIVITDYDVHATSFQEDVESLFQENLNQVSEMLKNYRETITGKKVEKMEIVNGELKVTFAAEKAKAESKPEPKPEPRPPQPEPFIKPEEAAKLAALPRKEALGKIVDKMEERLETVTRLRETIANAQKVIEENEKREQAILQRLAEIREEKHREEIDKPERERREKLEKDKQENPFKYFLIDKLQPESFKIIFGENKENVSLENINHVMGESGQKLKIFNFEYILPINNNTVHFTSNGFTLQLQNVGEVMKEENGKQVVGIFSPEARYKLVSPDWKCYENETTLSYQEGRRLLEERARQYQAEQVSLFESQVKK